MFRILDTLNFTLERIRQHLVLVLWVLVGITVAVTLTLSLPLYVDAVYSGILESRLNNPPYAYLYRYLGAWEGNIGVNDVDSVDAAITDQFVEAIGLPVAREVQYTSTGRYAVRFTETNFPLGNFTVGHFSGSDDLMQITSGKWPAQSDDERLPLLVHETMMFGMGIQAGDSLTIQPPGAPPVQAYIAATWRPLNVNDPQWLFPPRFFEQVFLAPQDPLRNAVTNLATPVDEAAWYIIFDGSDLRTAEIGGLLSSSQVARAQIDRILPGISLSESPEDGLQNFLTEVNDLTNQLFIIILPVGGLVLYFISVVSGLLVTRQQTEDVKLRSRGMSRGSVLTIHFLMWTVIVGIALAISIGLSPFLVQLIARTESFLDFTGVDAVPEVIFSTEALLYAVGAGLVAASSGLFLAWRITLMNINSLKRVDKAARTAWWQRIYLDLVVLAIAGYVLYTLLQQQGINTSADSPFSDPLVFTGPTLFSLGLTLIFLRVFPFIMNILGRFVSVTNNIPVLMALRELTRNAGRYRGTLLMTAFTLSLAGFTASMASTLDQSLLDVIQYRTGAEMTITVITDAATEQNQDQATGETTEEITGYNAPPVIDLWNLNEINYLSRVGEYESQMTVGGQRITGVVLGVDREGLGGVTYMRDDYSAVPLGNMLNEFALNRTGIILSQHTAEANNILLGDEVRYQIRVLGAWTNEIRATVVGFIDYFPTMNPVDYDFFLIAAYEPLTEFAGTPLPFDVWLNVNNSVSLESAQTAITNVNFPVLSYSDVESALAAAQAEPSRRGVLGFLSVGFVAAIVLTLIGSVIQSTASLQAQASQLGSLRAMGMSGFSVRLYVLLVQILMAIGGVGSGTLIGVSTTILFLPQFDFSGGLPPYQLRLAWDEILLVYGMFGAALVVVALIMALVLTRQQLSQAVKIGSV